jgi:hypothetical protein
VSVLPTQPASGDATPKSIATHSSEATSSGKIPTQPDEPPFVTQEAMTALLTTNSLVGSYEVTTAT